MTNRPLTRSEGLPSKQKPAGDQLVGMMAIINHHKSGFFLKMQT